LAFDKHNFKKLGLYEEYDDAMTEQFRDFKNIAV
jgi:hypothetical protein